MKFYRITVHLVKLFVWKLIDYPSKQNCRKIDFCRFQHDKVMGNPEPKALQILI